MTQDFESWLAEIVADEEDPTGAVDPRWRQWMLGVFQERGPLPYDEIRRLGDAEAERRQALQLDAARRLLPAIIADGHAVGMTMDVVLSLTEFGRIEVIASPEPGSRYYSTSSGDPMDLFMTDVELLAWLADEVQEATMERDQVHCFVWPTCAVHRTGGTRGC